MYLNVEAKTLKVHLVRGYTTFAACTETLQAILHYFSKTQVRIVGIEYHHSNQYFQHNYLIYCDYYLVRDEEAAQIREAMMNTDMPEKEDEYARIDEE
jgi:hypothetical protein